MISQTFSKAVLFLTVLCCVSVYAQVIDPVAAYPFISVTPASPAAGKDSVKLVLALGTAGNSCLAPTFTDISFVIQQSPLDIFPPIYTVALSYTLVPVPPGKMCPFIYAPVDYGPTFSFGKLALGTYNVADQVTKKLVGSFSVVNSPVVLKDSVSVTPKNPTTKDSITYNFFDADACCCAAFVDPAVIVQDNIVYLLFSVNTAPCMVCLCAGAGKWNAFKGGRLKTGRYDIYKQENIYCPPGQACPAIIMLPVKIGEVVVTSTAVSGNLPAAPKADGIIFRQEKNTVTMGYMLDRPAHMRISVFNARGMSIGRLCDGQAGAGTHGYSWTAAAQGVYFMSLEINGAAAAVRKIIVSRD
jgi:hypothetical protein